MITSPKIAIGLMSGTSADGVSAAAVSFKDRSFRILAYQTFPYPKKIRGKIHGAQALKAAEISALNFELGGLFAGAALKIMKQARLNPRKVSVIGSHGQTIYHGPNDRVPSTFQIGEAAVIAEETGVPVVSDFRPQDMALGGEGAPLVPFFDFYFYRNGPRRAFQNIGGISNVTIVGRGMKSPVAFDTGPGNCLMDLAIQKITRGRLSCDRDGRWAAKGKVNRRLVQSMLKHPYFRKRPPKSTGWEEFGEKFLMRYFGAREFKNPYDLLATLNFFTAISIYESLKAFTPSPHPSPPPGERDGSDKRRSAAYSSRPERMAREKGEGVIKEIVVSGGGARNRTLMRNLEELFSPVPVKPIESLGLPAQAKEPAAFAFFALHAIQGKINHLPETTGASHATVLGKITLAPPHPRPCLSLPCRQAGGRQALPLRGRGKAASSLSPSPLWGEG